MIEGKHIVGSSINATVDATPSAKMDENSERHLRTVMLLIFVAIAVPPSFGLTKPSGVKLQNNEYTGIVVAIHPDEPENPAIIDIIKEMFVNASSYLYTATKRRAYFGEVTILVPQTWCEDRAYRSPGNATFRGADVIVAAHNPRFAPHGPEYALPYTKQFTGCGEQSLYIHLTSHFLLNYKRFQRRVGNYGRLLVHEWGHYRWGLFNEHADKLRDLQRADYFYYSDTNQAWEPTSCSKGWSMHFLKRTLQECRTCKGNPNDGYEEGCIAAALSSQPGITGSIMQSVVPQDVINFCDNETHSRGHLHNREAPSRQNRFCDGKSSWEVMREHPDFMGESNNPPRVISDVTPTFHVARARPLWVVLVMDISGSMLANRRYLTLADAARTFITSILPDGSLVGLVEFSSTGTILSPLTEITSTDVRRNLANLVPVNPHGGTCIGCGLQTALEVLTNHHYDVKGSKVILITDGVDGNYVLLKRMMADYIAKKVTIDSIAITNTASDKIEDLAVKTGGKFYLQTDDIKSRGILDAFSDLYSTGNIKEYDRRMELHSGTVSFGVGESEICKSVQIDSNMGRATVFEFVYETASVAIDVRLVSPSGLEFTRGSSQYETDEEFKKVTIKIGEAEPGSWKYILQNQVTREDHIVRVSVSSYPSQHTVDQILVEAYLSSSKMGDKPLVAYAEVRQGFYPIVNATVVAIIETPAGTIVELPLLDNGAGSDITKEDGIYSRYFTQFTGTGYYGFKIQVSNEGQAKVISPGSWWGSNDASCQTAGDIFLILDEPIRYMVGATISNFVRYTTGGATNVPTLPAQWSLAFDSTPPSKITDLVVFNTTYNEGFVFIRFTAPGDDLDFGSASRYVIRWANATFWLRDHRRFIGEVTEADVIYGSILSPASFGNEENIGFRMRFPKYTSTVSYAISVYAVDEAGNEGKVSNMAQAAFRRNVPFSQAERETCPTWKNLWGAFGKIRQICGNVLSYF